MDLSVDRHLVFHDLKVFLVSYSISNVSMAIRTISSLHSGSALKVDLYPIVSAISENNSDSIIVSIRKKIQNREMNHQKL